MSSEFHHSLTPDVYDTRDVIDLSGVSANYLNKIIERKMFGIVPGVRPGDGPGSRRWFNSGDLYAIGLAWWLFQAGLRPQVIKGTLYDVGKVRDREAYSAAKALLEN